MADTKDLEDVASILRRDVLVMTSKAKSGHPSSCLSCSEIMGVLFFNEMRYDVKNAFNLDNDEFILSKGHAAPILYSCLFRSKCINYNLNSLRRFGSKLEGHPMPILKWVKVATGSLGQGLSIGIGYALVAKLQKRNYRTYVLMGDSEVSEGSVYEALQLASYYKLNNLTAIVDVNRLGQRGETILGHNLSAYKRRFQGFGWDVIIVDGHNVKELIKAFRKARGRLSVIIAKTFKGKGVSFLENKEGWHGRVLSEEQLKIALNEIPNVKFPKIKINKTSKINVKFKKFKLNFDNYKLDEEIATREAYGKALANLALSDESVLALDAEVSNSTFAEEVKKVKFKQFVECFIAEQNMIGMALGLSLKGYNVFASSFAAFLSRAHDQIRMSALTNGNLTICGSHAGISIGEDGPSQMGLEDIAMFRALPNSFVFYPSDAVSTEKLVYLTSKLKGIKYIRTTRAKTKVIYSNRENFKVGDFKVIKKSNKDKAVLAGAGITLHECLKAYDILKNKINVAVADLYCVKPFNYKKFIKFVKKHGNKIIVVEDHYEEGGIGEMLSSFLVNYNIRFRHLCIREIPHSGSKDELLRRYGIDYKNIVKNFKNFL